MTEESSDTKKATEQLNDLAKDFKEAVESIVEDFKKLFESLKEIVFGMCERMHKDGIIELHHANKAVKVIRRNPGVRVYELPYAIAAQRGPDRIQIRTKGPRRFSFETSVSGGETGK